AATALKQAHKALRRDPDSADFLRARAEAEQRLGRMRAAAETYALAGVHDPGNAWPCFHAGRLHLALGDQAAARTAFALAHARDPEMAATLARAMRAAEEQGEH